jgi:hypothetical protein
VRCRPVPERRNPYDSVLRLDHHDPRALTAEDVLVRLLRRHHHDSSERRDVLGMFEALPDPTVDDDRDARARVLVPREPTLGRERDLADREAADVDRPAARRALGSCHRGHLIG